MKSFGVGVISSLLLALAISSRVEAFDFPEVTPDPDAPSYLFLENTPITFLKRGETTNGRYTLAEVVLPPGTGVPPNIHLYEDEWYYVKEGNLQLVLGDKIYADATQVPGVNAPKDILHVLDAPPGTLLYAERNRIRGAANAGTTPVKLLFVLAPSGFENLIEEVSQPVSDLANLPPYNPETLSLFASTAPSYGLIVSSFLEQFGDIVVDNTLFNQDNHANELLGLLASDARPVPESSSAWSMLAFGTLGAILILKRKHKSVSSVH